ncbi:hypothetical protein ACFWQC_28025 [Nocardioides sp. NPDC058538]|uniref:hypothetical protein n=1 Tax=Nocardioides sp. NPDC058538 TaxID=3346542 RepID=UPI003653FD44
MVADTPTRPPLGDVAHIGHAQLFTPTPAATVAFFTDFLGLTVSGQDGDHTYLRTWDDYEHHSVVVTERATPGIGRTALRCSSLSLAAGRTDLGFVMMTLAGLLIGRLGSVGIFV